LKSHLLNNVDLVPAWSGLTVTGGRLNVSRAANAASATSTFRVLEVSRPAANTFRIMWSSVPGARYQVLSAPEMLAPFALSSGVITAGPDETTKSYTDTSAGGERKFYKVELVP